mgnify:CR=1 FL=1
MREALIQARNTKGLTQEQVAAAGNIGTRHYQYIEAGKCKPNVETAISIAKYLGCNVTDLFDPAAATGFHPSKEVFEAETFIFEKRDPRSFHPSKEVFEERARWVTTLEHESFHPSKEVFEARAGRSCPFARLEFPSL